MIRAQLFASVLLLAGCSGSGSDSSGAPGGVSAGEARALDDAAQMIDDQRLPAGAVPAAPPAPAKPPAAKPAG